MSTGGSFDGVPWETQTTVHLVVRIIHERPQTDQIQTSPMLVEFGSSTDLQRLKSSLLNKEDPLDPAEARSEAARQFLERNAFFGVAKGDAAKRDTVIALIREQMIRALDSKLQITN
jgi:hypothetical protein